MTDLLAPSDDALQSAPACPYKGLDSYTEADKDYFFARDSFRDLVAANLMASRITVLYGPSGVGKSSLLQAGVMPLLREATEGAFSYLAVENAIVVYSGSWRDDPLLELGSALLRAIPTPVAVSDLLAKRPALSLELLQDVVSRLGADIYLLLDQFEELALYHSGATGEAFNSELGRIIKAPGLPVSVLLGVRDDALAKLDRLEPHVPRILDNKLRLEQLSPSEAREAIERPLLRYNESVLPDRQVGLEPQLVEELLAQLQTGSVSVADRGEGVVTASDAVETPFLQLVMTRLWAAEAEQGSRVLRVETLRGLGGARQIVRTHLDTVMAELTEDQRATAASVFRYLVTPSGMKIAHTAEDLAVYVGGVDRARVMDVLEQLASKRERVLRPVPPPVGSNEPPRYEIFHDVMAPAVLDWGRRYAAERERMASEAGLVREKQEVEDRHLATRRQLRLSRMLSLALALLLVLVGFLFWKVDRSGKAAEQAALLAQYGVTLQMDPAASLKFAVDAWSKSHTPQADEAVRTALDADTERVKVQADKGPLSTSELSPDGQMLLTAGKDGKAKLFDAVTGTKLFSLEPAASNDPPELTAASFSPDGSLILTVTSTGEVRLYDATTGKDLGLLSDEGSYVEAVWGTVGGRPVVLTSDWNQPARLWDARGRYLLATYGTEPSGGAALSSDGRNVVTVEYVEATKITRVSVWDTASGQLRQRSEAVGANALMARFAGTDSGHIVLFAIERGALRWHLVSWDWRKGSKAIRQLDAKSRQPAVIVISEDGRLVAAPLDKRVRVFDADTGELVGETADAPDWVNAAVSFSRDGHWLATTGNDGRARVWLSEQINNRPVAELVGHRGGIADVRFDPDSDWRLTTAGYDGTARVWQLPDRTVIYGSGGWMLHAELGGDGQYLLTAEDNGALRIYHSTSGAGTNGQWSELSRTTIDWYGGLMGASFSPEGRKVVAADEFSMAPSVWDWQSGKIDDFDSWQDYIGAPVVSADGRRVAAGDYSGNVVVWDLDSGKIVAQLALGGEGSRVTRVAAVPGSDWFAAASLDGTVQLWDPNRPEAPQRTLGEKGDSPVEVLTVSADGGNLASVSSNREVQVWRLSDGERMQVFQGPPSTNSDLAFSRDGSLVAISAADGAVQIWRWADKHVLAVLHRHGDFVNSVQFTDRGGLVTSSDDSTVAMYPCTTCGSFDELLATARDRVKAHKG